MSVLTSFYYITTWHPGFPPGFVPQRNQLRKETVLLRKKMSTLLHFEQMNREETIYPEDNHETFGFEHLRTPTWDFKTCLGKSLVFLSKQKNKITPSEYLCDYILKHLSVIATQKIQVEWKYAKVPAFVLGHGFTGA